MAETRGVAIITEIASFPLGMAGTSRVRLYARGLSYAGMETRVFIVRGTELPESTINRAPSGIHLGVPFEYTGGRTAVPTTWAGRRLGELVGLVSLFRRLMVLRRDGWLKHALLYTSDLRFIKVFAAMAHYVRVPVSLDLCEWPLAKATYYGLNVGTARRFMSEGMPLLDGVLPISDYLVDQIEEYRFATGSEVRFLKVPIFVDTKRFCPSDSARPGIPTFLWCGSLDYTRIVMSLVDAAVLLKERGLPFRIEILGGSGLRYQLEKLLRYVERTATGDVVVIRDFIPEEELVGSYDQAAACLVLLRDDDISRSRFTTKLGEFLAMGRPVIASPIGELNRYLVDGKTAFFTRDLSPGALADAIASVANDRTRAETVGRAGRHLAETVFDYRVQGTRVAEFLDSLGGASQGRS